MLEHLDKMVALSTRIRRIAQSHSTVLVLLSVCLIVFSLKVVFISKQDFLFGYDEANYAAVGKNLVEGRGFSTDFVLHFFLKYPEVSHPEDRRLSANSVVIALSFLMFGKNAFAAKLPNILIGTILLPMTTFLLARSLKLRNLVGLFAGLSIIIIQNTDRQTYSAMADLLWTQFFVLFVLSLVKSIDEVKWSYGVGIYLGLCFLIKPQAIILFPIVLFYQFSMRGVRATVKNKHILLGMSVAILIMAPYLLRNYFLFHDPFFSTIRYDLDYGYLHEENIVAWWGKTFRVYWDTQVPTYSSEVLSSNLQQLAIKPLRQTWLAIRLLGNVFFISLLSIFVFWGNKRVQNLWVIISSYILIIASFFYFHERYEMPLVPIILILTWATLAEILRKIKIDHYILTKNPNNPLYKYISVFIFLFLFLLLFNQDGKSFISNFNQKGYRFQIALIDIAKWTKLHLPDDSIVMTHAPALFNFYSGRKAVSIPYDDKVSMEKVVRQYKVTHAIPWTLEKEKFSHIKKLSGDKNNIMIRLLDPGLPYSNLEVLIKEYHSIPVYKNNDLGIYKLNRIP